MTVTVVIPVRDGAALLAACLDHVMPEAARHDARVVVVDDASSDASAEIARRHGAEVLVRTRPEGPYAARNAGWRHTSSPRVVFTDTRCRPRQGWLGGLLAGLDDPAMAVVGGDVHASWGPSAAERYAHRWQPLMPDRGLSHPFLPFLPTCNVATRREVLEAVDGFRQIRSGGDLDFCWRVQLHGAGSVGYAPDAAVDWAPRTTVREVMRQWYRYGAAKPSLFATYREHGLTADPPPLALKQAYWDARLFAKGLRDRPVREWDVEVVDRLCQLAFQRGYRKQWRQVTRTVG
jgi:glycosyltransferase involved in cell wall biosynthesis